MSGHQVKGGWLGPFMIAWPFLLCLNFIAGGGVATGGFLAAMLAVGFSLTWAGPRPRLKRPAIRDGEGLPDWFEQRFDDHDLP